MESVSVCMYISVYAKLYTSVPVYVNTQTKKRRLLLALFTLLPLLFPRKKKYTYICMSFFMFHYTWQRKYFYMQEYCCNFIDLTLKLILHLLDIGELYRYFVMNMKMYCSSHSYWHPLLYQKHNLLHIRECSKNEFIFKSSELIYDKYVRCLD